jgi:hypothetical protein
LGERAVDRGEANRNSKIKRNPRASAGIARK